MNLKKLWHRVVLFFCVNCVIVHITINNDIAANIDNNVKFLNFKNQFWPSKHRFSLVLTLLQIFEWKNQTIYWESKEKLLKSFKPITCPGEFFWSNIWSDSTEQRLRTISTVIRNRKIAWKHGPYCWYFCLNLKYMWRPYGEYIKTTKNCGFCEKLQFENWKQLWGCFNHFLLLRLWCQRFWGSSEDRYRSKSSQILLVCYSLQNSQNGINQ